MDRKWRAVNAHPAIHRQRLHDEIMSATLVRLRDRTHKHGEATDAETCPRDSAGAGKALVRVDVCTGDASRRSIVQRQETPRRNQVAKDMTG